MMIDPKAADDQEARRVDRKLRRQPRQQARPDLIICSGLGQLQLEHHDGDDDGDDAITERGYTLGAQTSGTCAAAMLRLHALRSTIRTSGAVGCATRTFLDSRVTALADLAESTNLISQTAFSPVTQRGNWQTTGKMGFST